MMRGLQVGRRVHPNDCRTCLLDKVGHGRMRGFDNLHLVFRNRSALLLAREKTFERTSKRTLFLLDRNAVCRDLVAACMRCIADFARDLIAALLVHEHHRRTFIEVAAGLMRFRVASLFVLFVAWPENTSFLHAALPQRAPFSYGVPISKDTPLLSDSMPVPKDASLLHNGCFVHHVRLASHAGASRCAAQGFVSGLRDGHPARDRLRG